MVETASSSVLEHFCFTANATCALFSCPKYCVKASSFTSFYSFGKVLLVSTFRWFCKTNNTMVHCLILRSLLYSLQNTNLERLAHFLNFYFPLMGVYLLCSLSYNWLRAYSRSLTIVLCKSASLTLNCIVYFSGLIYVDSAQFNLNLVCFL